MPFYEIHNSGAAFKATSSRHSLNMTFPLHMHASFELLLVEEGEITVTIDQAVYTAVAGDLVLIPPSATHAYKTERYSLAGVIIFTPNYLSEIYDEMRSGIYRHPVMHGEDALLADLHESEKDPLLFRSYLYRMAAVYAKNSVIGQGSAPDTRFAPLFSSYMEAHCREALSEEQVAHTLGYHPRYLSHLIKRSFGVSFRRVLNEYRIKQASLLLESESESITEIYLAVGFESQTTFNRNFKLIMGVTPAAYRRGLRIGQTVHGE